MQRCLRACAGRGQEALNARRIFRRPSLALTRMSLAPYQRVAFMVRLSSFLEQIVAPGASAGLREAAHSRRRVGAVSEGSGGGA